MDPALRQERDQTLRLFAVGGDQRHGVPVVTPEIRNAFLEPHTEQRRFDDRDIAAPSVDRLE
jgi:hypothetical protein